MYNFNQLQSTLLFLFDEMIVLDLKDL